jgi:hypothetical protein
MNLVRFISSESVKVMLFTLIMLPIFAACQKSSHQPCQISVGGICYDSPKASNPPLTASWEMIDADTKKPLAGVWVSFYWRKFADGSKRDGSCARNVIGQTDANGRFSDTAKDGSWMFSDVYMFKPGYQRIRFQRLVGQVHITDKYELFQDFVGKYPGWENALKTMGYRLDTTSTTNNYSKNFALGSDYPRIMKAAWETGGERQYWLTKRGIPDGTDVSSLGIYTCYNRALGKADPSAELIGYRSVDWDQNSPWNRDISTDALQTICDEKWDSVPADFSRTYSHQYASTAFGIVPQSAHDQLRELLPEYFAAMKSHSEPMRAMTRPERMAFCSFVKPYANQLKEQQ